jgi:lactate permease
VLRAWSPFILLTVLVADWGIRPVKLLLDRTTFKLHVPLLHQALVNPATGKAIDAVYKVDWLAAAGTAIFVACLLSAIVTRMSPRDVLAVFGKTLKSMVYPLITIASVLGFAYIGNASGVTTTLGRALAATGAIFPLVCPLLGWLGVFITGSDTSANAIFGKLQQVSAQALANDPTTNLQVLTVAGNTSGGGTGKMVSPQSIAVACAATGMVGRESEMLRFTFKHSLLMVSFVCVLTYLQATVLRFMVPPFLRAHAAEGTVTSWVGTELLVATGVALLALVLAVRERPAPAAKATPAQN